MIVTVVRPYGGAEGKRIRVGTRFWVKKPGAKATGPKNVQAIDYQRYQALKAKGMVVDGETDHKAPGVKVTTRRKAPSLGKYQGAEKTDRDKSNKKHKADQNGGRTGKGAASSSLPGGQVPVQSGGLIGHRKKRGQRGSDGSPSTTASNSAHGQTANTQQTGDGGGTTQSPSETGENGTPKPYL